jgi:hypothetical protein
MTWDRNEKSPFTWDSSTSGASVEWQDKYLWVRPGSDKNTVPVPLGVIKEVLESQGLEIHSKQDAERYALAMEEFWHQVRRLELQLDNRNYEVKTLEKENKEVNKTIAQLVAEAEVLWQKVEEMSQKVFQLRIELNNEKAEKMRIIKIGTEEIKRLKTEAK